MMIAALAPVLAVMLLAEPDEGIDAAALVAFAEDENHVEAEGVKPAVVKSATITSRTSDFDRKEGVVMFEGDVVVRYAADYIMCADSLYMFLSKSNELSRVVAVGNVSITNDTRTGTCAMATYRRQKSEVEMFWDGSNRVARLVESGDGGSELAGTRIKFWLDSEQVEVDNSHIAIERSEGDVKKAL